MSKEGIYCFWCKKWYSNSHFTKHLNKQGICPNKIVIEKQLENVFHIYTGVDPVLLEFEKVKPTKMKSVAEIESEIFTRPAECTLLGHCVRLYYLSKKMGGSTFESEMSARI